MKAGLLEGRKDNGVTSVPRRNNDGEKKERGGGVNGENQ